MAIKISGSTIIDDSGNIVNAGIVTATQINVGTAVTISSGVITATTVSANEFVGTGDKLIFKP